MNKNKKIKIIGHRGAKGYEPENTLCSFKRALDLRVDMIEFDVRALPTGEVVLLHDFAVNRTTNGRGRIRNLSFEYLRRLDAGKGEKVPTLQEALDFIGQKVQVYIELKGKEVAGPVAKILRQYLRQGWRQENILVASFNHDELRAFKKKMPRIKTLSLYYRGVGKYFGITGKIEKISWWQRFYTPGLIKKARNNDEQFIIGTSNRCYQARRFAKKGVDAIVTNYPDRMQKALSTGRL